MESLIPNLNKSLLTPTKSYLFNSGRSDFSEGPKLNEIFQSNFNFPTQIPVTKDKRHGVGMKLSNNRRASARSLSNISGSDFNNNH